MDKVRETNPQGPEVDRGLTPDFIGSLMNSKTDPMTDKIVPGKAAVGTTVANGDLLEAAGSIALKSASSRRSEFAYATIDLGATIGFARDPLPPVVWNGLTMAAIAQCSQSAGSGLTMTGRFMRDAGAAPLLGGVNGLFDADLFMRMREDNNLLGQCKYAAALTADVGMMAPMLGLVVGGKGALFRNLAYSGGFARILIELVPDKVTTKR